MSQKETADTPIQAMSHPLVQDLMLNPKEWKIWPAVAILRWVIGKSTEQRRRLVYRSRATLSFATSEIDDVGIQDERLELTLNAVGLASAGSPLPTPDIMRVIEDARRGGAMSTMLDGPGDRFMQALEGMLAKNHTPFALITGGQVDAFGLVSDIVGRSAPLSANKDGALFETRWRVPEGAIGLASGFVGPTSAQGLARVMEAFTGLATHIEEFTGREVLVPGRHGSGGASEACWACAAEWQQQGSRSTSTVGPHRTPKLGEWTASGWNHSTGSPQPTWEDRRRMPRSCCGSKERTHHPRRSTEQQR